MNCTCKEFPKATGGRRFAGIRLRAAVANSALLHCNNSSVSHFIAIGTCRDRPHAKSARIGASRVNTPLPGRIGLPGCARIDASGAVDISTLAISPLIARRGRTLYSVASCRRLHRLHAKVHRVRGQPLQALVLADAVVELEINSELAVCFGNRAVGVQIHLLIICCLQKYVACISQPSETSAFISALTTHK
jgi:hypothetical protein